MRRKRFAIMRSRENGDTMNENQNRTRIAQRAGITGIICNLLLFVFKLAVGMAANSVSILADAFNNLTDAGSSVISLVGTRLAGKGADEKHPFGHGRLEYVTTFVVAFIVIQVGFGVFKDSFGKILHPEEMKFSAAAVIVLAGGIVAKLAMSVYFRRVAKKIDSGVFQATAADALGDVLATSGALAALVVYGVWNVSIDGLIGIAVSLIVISNGVKIAMDTLIPLIGEAPPPELVRRIRTFVEQYDGIVGTHDLIVHSYGPNQYMATIHAEVPRDGDFDLLHEIVDKIERDARKELGIVLVIHMDPVDVRDETVKEYRGLVSEVLEKLDPKLRFHDFRIIHGERVNLIFDLETPWDYSEEKQNETMLAVCRQVSAYNPKLRCVITVEKPYVTDPDGGGATRMDKDRPVNED